MERHLSVAVHAAEGNEGFCGEVILSAENLEHAALLLLPVYGIL